jgi:hypothetical protein
MGKSSPGKIRGKGTKSFVESSYGIFHLLGKGLPLALRGRYIIWGATGNKKFACR